MSSTDFFARIFARYFDRVQEPYERNVAWRKRALFAGVSGTIVEIGAGTGINLSFYPPEVRWIGVEPNVHMHDALRARALEAGIDPDLRVADAEAIDLPDGAADVAVSTLVLCSVRDPRRTVAELRRVLRPGGRFLFLEHVAAPRGRGLRLAQRALTPVWRHLAGGCHLDRDTGALIRGAGFARVELQEFQADPPSPALVRPHVIGCATR